MCAPARGEHAPHQFREELETLAAESAPAEVSCAQAEAARKQLRDAEGFLEELSRRLHELTTEEMAAIVHRAMPRVTVSPRGDGRKVARSTYRFAAPSDGELAGFDKTVAT